MQLLAMLVHRVEWEGSQARGAPMACSDVEVMCTSSGRVGVVGKRVVFLVVFELLMLPEQHDQCIKHDV